MARFVDTLPTASHPREMKVVVLSASRNGTLGLHNAFKMLGYHSYHQLEAFERGADHLKMFSESMRASHLGQGQPYSKTDFDKWLGEYDALTDISTYLLEDLVRAYPHAKFILTTRDENAWVRSVKRTLVQVFNLHKTFPFYVLQYFDRYIWNMLDCTRATGQIMLGGNDFGDGAVAKAFYKEHNKRALELVPKDRLLIVRLEDGLGWEEICPFLGVDIPPQPFPISNDPEAFKAVASRVLGSAVNRAALKMVTTIVPIVGVAVGLYKVWH